MPRYLCFGERRELPEVGIASAIAEGFLTAPGRRRTRATARARRRPPAVRVAPEAAATSSPVAAAPPRRGGRAARSRCGYAMAKLDAAARRGHRPLPGGLPAHRRPAREVRARSGRPGAGQPHRRTGRRRRPGDAAARPRRAAASRPCATGAATSRSCSTADRPPAAEWRPAVDIGDHVGVTGEVVTTQPRRADRRVDAWPLTAKCLRPLPDKHRGLADPEARVRQRYLDLSSTRARGTMLRGARDGVHALRESLLDRGFLEVETPILQRIHGGANARPFTTHINAYDLRLYLRIAPELYLKRLPSAASSGSSSSAARSATRAWLQAQPGVHDARGLPGVRRLRHDAGR